MLVTGWIAFVSWRNTIISRRIFEAAYRPLIGVTDIQAVLRNGYLDILITLENVGTVPSKHQEIEWDILINGQGGLATRQGLAGMTSTSLFPKSKTALLGSIVPAAYDSIVRGATVLEVTVDIRYQGIAQQKYRYQSKHRYHAQRNGFFVLSSSFE